MTKISRTNSQCLICQGALSLLTAEDQLLGSSSRADALYPFSLQQCAVCGHIQKELDEVWHASIKDLYEQDYKLPGRKINIVDGKIVNRESCLVNTLDKMLKLGEHGAFLDIGCGAGHLLAAFSTEKPDWNIAGQDVSATNKDYISKDGTTTFYQGPLRDIKEHFDLITLNHVAEHLTDPVTVLHEASLLLKPGGHMVVVVPSFLSVYTDFFFMEHCSHFTYRTLTIAASLAGLEVQCKIEGLKDVEIGIIAVKSEQNSLSGILERLTWATGLPGFIRANAFGRSIGIFGVSGAGLWLGTILQGEISFFVDEDPSKQGSEFAGCPIFSVPDVPRDSVVFVTLNNPATSLEICEKLRSLRSDITFVAPPRVIELSIENDVR